MNIYQRVNRSDGSGWDERWQYEFTGYTSMGGSLIIKTIMEVSID